MNVRYSSGTKIVNALEWTEAEIASGMSFDDFGNCVAYLGGEGLIESVTQTPGLLGRLGGKEGQHYFWITDTGIKFLKENVECEIPQSSTFSTPQNVSAQDIDSATLLYENSKSHNSYVEADDVIWAERLLDEDIKAELEMAALEAGRMWAAFEEKFGHRGAVVSETEAAFRDPVRVIRARDEQRRRKGFGPSLKPEAWSSLFNNGDVGLEPPPWR